MFPSVFELNSEFWNNESCQTKYWWLKDVIRKLLLFLFILTWTQQMNKSDNNRVLHVHTTVSSYYCLIWYQIPYLPYRVNQFCLKLLKTTINWLWTRIDTFIVFFWFNFFSEGSGGHAHSITQKIIGFVPSRWNRFIIIIYLLIGIWIPPFDK